MNRKQWGTRKQIQSKKLPKQQIQKITQRQYQKAMKHLQRLSFYQLNKTMYTEPLDPQCTFQPQIHTIKKNNLEKGANKNITKHKNDNHQNTQQRLIKWGMEKNIRRRQNILTGVLQAQKIKQVPKKPEQKQRHLQYKNKSYCRTGRSQISLLVRNKFKSPSKLGQKKRSETTFMNQTNVKSKSSLLSRLLQ